MIALALLRIGGIGSSAVSCRTCTHHPLCYRIMRDAARRFAGVTFFPDPDSAAINFRTATLAQRIVREINPNYRLQASTGAILGTAERSCRPQLSTNPQIDSLFGQHQQPANRMLAGTGSSRS